MGVTLGTQTISTQLQRIAAQAALYPDMVFNNLYHKVNKELLREAYRQTRKDGAPGLDKVQLSSMLPTLKRTWRSYVSVFERGHT
jgi:RNA-directed DNA polymerase